MNRLFIVRNDGEEAFSIQSENKEYLKDHGEEWKRLQMIRSYYIVPVREKTRVENPIP